MLNRCLITAAASQFQNDKAKPPWEDKSNYRESKRGYHSNCHLWHNIDEVDNVRESVWQTKRKPAAPLTLITQCGSDRCIRLTHLVPASKSDISFIDFLREERKDWRYNMGSIRLIARRMRWEDNELSLVLRIPRRELKELLENGPKEDVPYGERNPGPASGQPKSDQNAAASTQSTQSTHSEPNSAQINGEPPRSDGAMPPPPPIPMATNQSLLGNPSNLSAHPGEGEGALELVWSPAANATAHFVYFRQDGSAEAYRLPQQLPGNCGTVSLSELTGGRHWFILIACQTFSKDQDVVWSEWSNWIMADV